MTAKRTLPPSELALIEVVVPGIGLCQPWRQSDYGFDADGRVVL